MGLRSREDWSGIARFTGASWSPPYDKAAAGSDRDRHRFHDPPDDAFHHVALRPLQVALGDHAVGEHRHRESLDVVGRGKLASFDIGQRLTSPIEAQGAAGAHADVQCFRLASRMDDVEQVIGHALLDSYLAGRVI